MAGRQTNARSGFPGAGVLHGSGGLRYQATLASSAWASLIACWRASGP